jgi:hypothetical protein
LKKQKLVSVKAPLLMALLVGLLVSTVTFAQNEMQKQTLSLSQAIELALKTDCTVKSAINSLEKNKLIVKKAVLNISPTATVQGEYQTMDDTYPNSYQIVIIDIVALGQGVQQNVINDITAMGPNLVMVFPRTGSPRGGPYREGKPLTNNILPCIRILPYIFQ